MRFATIMNSVKVLFNSIDNLIPNYGRDESIDEVSDSEYQGHETHAAKLEEIDENEVIDSQIELDHDPETAKTREKLEGIDEQQEHNDFLEPNYSIHLIFRGFIRLPYLIIVYPLSFFWSILLYPILMVFKSFEFNYTYHMDFQEKTELLKHENMLLNNIKSPSSSSNYIVPPPQRLFPLVRNPQKGRKRKTLILDLDETLIHSLSKGFPRTLNGNNSNIIEIKLNNIATLYHVHKRPYCDYFLKEISKWFDLQIFTASVKEYADPIIDWLENDMFDEKIFKKRYYRTDCTYRNGVGYIKDLSAFFPVDEMKNVVILDNSPVSYALNEDNAVMIEGWINDQNDKDLLNLLPMLHSLSLCIDVRYILGLRQGEKVLES